MVFALFYNFSYKNYFFYIFFYFFAFFAVSLKEFTKNATLFDKNVLLDLFYKVFDRQNA